MASADPKKRQEWLERLARHGASERSVAQFCADEGVSVASFYQWRRKLSEAPAAKSSASTNKFQRLHVQGGAAITARLPNGVVLEVSGRAVGECLDRLFSSGGEVRC